ncbi:MAG: PQQ-like beta-propeller repeat protein [Bryobacterales bacterium]|nr:PQQ-like beta-propeller repeat protein [Bryobacterales bacterium]
MKRRAALPLIAASGFAFAADEFHDPAPPKAEKLTPIDTPPAKANPTVRFHAKPKPLAPGAVTHDWTSFLGPTHNAISTETKLLHEWEKSGPPLVWEMRTGSGYSSPAIAGERLVFFHRQENREKVECLRAESGEKYWEFRYPTQFEDRYGYNNGPRASPVIDGERVYTYGAEGKLHCFRLETGQLYWKRDLAVEFKVPQDFFGTATTPLIEGGLLIINVGAPGGPMVAAFDKISGRMVWGAGKEWGPSYASPVPAVVHGKRRVFVFAGGESRPPAGGLIMLDPKNGAIDFTFPWRSKSYESVNAASPVATGNQVFISASYKTGGALLNVLPDGKSSVAWTSNEIGTHFNTAVYRDGYLYAFDGRNEPDASLVCVEWKTGKVMWRVNPEWEQTLTFNGESRKQTLGTFRGTLLWADGHFLCLGELGYLLWLDLTPKGYRQHARAWLFAARETWSLPVLSHGLLYISQHSRDMLNQTPPRLLCYDLRGSG